MPSITRKGDNTSGHGCFPPSPTISASPNVYVNGIQAVRKGDAVAPHGCGSCPPHPRKVSVGSGNVYINGQPAARQGDAVDCGGTVIAGSGTVFVNG